MLELYKRFSLREKTLVVGFIWVLILAWGLGAFGRMTQALGSVRQQKELIKSQEIIISREAQIDADLKALQSKFDAEKTYTKEELIEKLEEFAQGMKFSMSTSQTQEGEIFNVHSVPVRFRDETMGSLMAFGEKLREELLISIERASIQSDRKDPRKLDAVFDITSFELKQQSP